MNLLVLLLRDADDAVLHEAVGAREQPATRIRVVAPARVGALAWLASDDSGTREAESRLLAAEWMLSGGAEVEGDTVDADPAQAVEDALRSFPADEILVSGAGDDGLLVSLARFGLPVDTVACELRRRSAVHSELSRLAAGQALETPFVLFLLVLAAFSLGATFLSGCVLLGLWAAGLI